jgi:hypothetical protein
MGPGRTGGAAGRHLSALASLIVATTKKVAKKTAGKAASAKTAAKTAAKKPYPDNTGANTKPPKVRPPDAIDLLVEDHLAAGE